MYFLFSTAYCFSKSKRTQRDMKVSVLLKFNILFILFIKSLLFFLIGWLDRSNLYSNSSQSPVAVPICSKVFNAIRKYIKRIP